MKRSWLVGLILGCGVGLLFVLAFLVNISFLAAWQQFLSDLLFLKQRPSEQIIIVAVDEKSLARVGRWPWPRSVHTRLIDIVAGHEAKAIGMNIRFSKTSNAAEDKSLAGSLSRANRVILPVLFDLKGTQLRYEVAEAKSIESPAKVFSRVARGVGHVNVYPDSDGVVRSLPLVVEIKGRRYLALPLLVLGQAEPSFEVVLQPRETRTVKLRSREIPLERGAKMRVNFAGPGGTFRTVSYTDVLVGKVDPAIFKDKIVLVGITAKTLGDRYMTPTSEDTPISGVEIHANAINTILEGNFLVEQSPLATVLLILVLSSLCGLAFLRLRALWSGLIALGLVGLTVVFAVVCFKQGVIVNIVYPLLAVFGAYTAAVAYRFIFARIHFASTHD